MVQYHLVENGVSVYFNEKVVRIEGKKRVEKVVTDNRTLEADMVIIAAGIIPNSDLARSMGLNISSKGGILVNKRMQTSYSPSGVFLCNHSENSAEGIPYTVRCK